MAASKKAPPKKATASKSKSSAGRQAEKSLKTRERTLKATVDCFYEIGYANTSTKKVADRAQISRGAMIHHFASKRELLTAAVDYIIDRRIESFTNEIEKNLKDPQERLEKGLDVYWKHLHTRYFVAYHELTVAARTDKELNAVMKKAARKFEERWQQAILDVFPEWQDTGPLIQLAMDVCQFSFEGMALNKLSHDAQARQKLLVDYIKSRVRDMFDAAQTGNHDKAVAQFLHNAK